MPAIGKRKVERDWWVVGSVASGQEGLGERGRNEKDEGRKKQRARQEGGFSWCPFPPRWRRVAGQRPIQPHSTHLPPRQRQPGEHGCLPGLTSDPSIRCNPLIMHLEAKVSLILPEEGTVVYWQTRQQGRYYSGTCQVTSCGIETLTCAKPLKMCLHNILKSGLVLNLPFTCFAKISLII